MPTFSTSGLNRSIKQGALKSLEIPSNNKPLSHSKPPTTTSNGEANTFTLPKMTPSLYATPKQVQLPNSPSSFPPSPYIVLGTGLLRSSPQVDVDKIRSNADVEAIAAENHTPERPVWDRSPTHGNFWNERPRSDIANGSNNVIDTLEWERCLLEPVRTKANKERREFENIYNKGESVSFTSNTEVVEEFIGAKSSLNLPSSSGEFYDAHDELSSNSGSESSVNNRIDTELRETRLSLLMEIEKRRQAEETLEQMRLHWRKLREQLADVGLFLPLDPTISQYRMNIADEIRCQIEVARFVSDSVDSDLAKAEVEMEMESKIEAKNFEISRLSDRLRSYETVIQEMSQRNQEAIEMARRNGEKRKKKLRWIWGSIVATSTLGGAVLACPYLHTGISSSDSSDVAQPQQSPVD